MKALPNIDDLQGVYAAAITPRGQNGDINFGALFELIDYLSAARVAGIALFTACGEYPALAIEDRARVTYLAVKRSRVPVLAGVGSATLDHSLELAREARAAGVAAVLLPPPLYYRYDEDDILEFYTQFASQLGSGPPIVISGEMEPRAACRLLETGCFAGIENGHGTTGILESLRGCSPPGTLFAADDRGFVEARSAGLAVMSAAACAAPELSMALNCAIAAADGPAIARLETMRQELLSWLDRFPFPIGLKTAVAARGIQTGPLHVPLPPAKAQCLNQFREWLKTWMPATKKLASRA